MYDAEGNLVKKTKNNQEQSIKLLKKEQEKTVPIKAKWIDKVFGYTDDDTSTPNISPDIPITHWRYGEWFYTWQANGMLKSVKDPTGKVTSFEYDALGRRTAKINRYKQEINRYIYDGNVLLHEFRYHIDDKPKVIADDLGRLSFDKQEPTDNLITWVFDEGTFVPSAKITEEGTFSIISDYLGTPILSFDEKGNKVWERELDSYGNVRKGDNRFVPFLYQGQYFDEETGLAYNRFRYYSPDTGTYISQDPIGLAGGMPNMYSYVHDLNTWVDPFGLSECGFSKNFDKKLRTHANDIYQTAKRLGINIVKGDKDAMKKFIKSITNESSNLANSKPFKWNTIESTNAFVNDKAVVLVNTATNEITTFLHKDRISSYLIDSMDLL